MEAVYSYKAYCCLWSTRRHKPEYSTFCSHHCENHKSKTEINVFTLFFLRAEHFSEDFLLKHLYYRSSKGRPYYYQAPSHMYYASWKDLHDIRTNFSVAVITQTLSVSQQKQQNGQGQPVLLTNRLAFSSLQDINFVCRPKSRLCCVHPVLVEPYAKTHAQCGGPMDQLAAWLGCFWRTQCNHCA